MQALASCPSIASRCTQLWRYLRNYHEDNIDLQKKFELFASFLRIIHHLSEEYQSTLDKNSLISFRTLLGEVKPVFSNDEQHDAHEFLLKMIELIDETMKKKKNKTGSNAKTLTDDTVLALDPLLAIRHNGEECKTCHACNKHSTTVGSYLIRNISLASQKRSSTGLRDMIESDFEQKTVEMNCDDCGCKKAFDRGRFQTFPQCLIFHLVRSVHDENRKSQKDERPVEIPMELDLSKFSSFPEISAEMAEVDKDSRDGGRRLLSDVPKLPAKNFHNGIETAPRILGGAKNESEEIMFDSEIIHQPLCFKPLSSSEVIIGILSNLGIKYDSERLNLHIQKLESIETKTMKKDDAPERTEDIKTDGNCFFRAVSWYLTGVQSHHKTLRKATVEYLERNGGILQKYCTNDDFEEHKKKMKQDGAWATNCEVVAFSKMLNVNVYTFLNDGWFCHSPSQVDTSETGSIYLNNTTKHFEPVLSIRSNQVESRARRAKKRAVSDSEDDGNMNEDSDEETEGTSERTPKSRQHLKRKCTENRQETENTETAVSVTYKLVAVVCHKGSSADKGHYTALTKHLFKNEWIKCDDSIIEKISEARVQSEAASEGYIMFYDRQ